METNTLYEYNVVKSMEGMDKGISEIKTGHVIVHLKESMLTISVEDGELKIYKSGGSVSRIIISPTSSNVITVK